ncbi:hypothetical protein [uncultured Chryseobacterium sp.]|uniref:hypothetical protein n=1 Tax=uncultured Chryseobacterium sp. TaxID=259322 RepID=UPI0025EBF9DB|nr:hypothetical protein [uncultured Chryseobacterium sp.]
MNSKKICNPFEDEKFNQSSLCLQNEIEKLIEKYPHIEEYKIDLNLCYLLTMNPISIKFTENTPDEIKELIGKAYEECFSSYTRIG